MGGPKLEQEKREHLSCHLIYRKEKQRLVSIKLSGKLSTDFPCARYLGAGEEVFVYLSINPSWIKEKHSWLTEVCDLWHIQSMSVPHAADANQNHQTPSCTFQQRLEHLAPLPSCCCSHCFERTGFSDNIDLSLFFTAVQSQTEHW